MLTGQAIPFQASDLAEARGAVIWIGAIPRQDRSHTLPPGAFVDLTIAEAKGQETATSPRVTIDEIDSELAGPIGLSSSHHRLRHSHPTCKLGLGQPGGAPEPGHLGGDQGSAHWPRL